MERTNTPTDQEPQVTDELPPVADPVHHGDDDLPAPVDLDEELLDETLDQLVEPEPEEDLTKW